jgi:hypothetical protein
LNQVKPQKEPQNNDARKIVGATGFELVNTYPRDVRSGLFDVQRISQDCAIGESVFRQVNQPTKVKGQRASALRFAEPAV